MMATIFEPEATGLPVYVIFNCEKEFGWIFQILREKDIVNIGITKDYGGIEPAGRFNWDKVLPIYVSNHPLALVSGNLLADEIPGETVCLMFSQQEMEEVIKFIKRNQQVIEQHWYGEIDDLKLHKSINYNKKA